MKTQEKEYAVYRGDEFWTLGTREEILQKTGISYLYFMRAKSPAQFRKIDQYKNINNTLLIIEIEEDES